MQQDNVESEVKDQIVLRYLSRAIGDQSQIPWRVATRLFDTNLIDTIEDDSQELEDLASTLQKDSELVNTHSMPLYFFNDDQAAELGYHHIYISELMGFRNMALCKLISSCMKRVIYKSISSDVINELVNEYADYANNDDLKNALIVAAKIDEGLMDNWEWNILILKQSSQNNLDQLVQKQISKLLSIKPNDQYFISDLENKYNQSLNILKSTRFDASIFQVESVLDELNKVGPHVAHLPWNNDIGFGSLLSNIKTTQENIDVLWDNIRYWLEFDKPAWWFHVWYVAVSHPKMVPSNIWEDIWRKIGFLLGANAEEGVNETYSAGRYLKLLEFYIYRLESSLFSENSDFLYWASSKLASDFLSSIENVSSSFDDTLDEAVYDARLVWQVAAADYDNTPIRSSFIAFRNYWISAIQSSISNWQPSEIKGLIPNASLPNLKTFIKMASLQFNNVSDNKSKTSNQLLLSIHSPLDENWKIILPDELTQQYIDTHNHLVNKLNDPELIIQHLSSPFDEGDVEGIVALLCLNSFINEGKISTSQVFDIISSKHWLSEVEPSLPIKYFDHIIGSLLNKHSDEYKRLNVDIPHWAVQKCLDNIDDENKLRVYFPAIVLLSIKGNTSSAISRVMFEDSDNKLVDEINNMKNTLRRIINISPGWLSGRIRAVLSVL